MTSEELEKHLEGARETPNLEFKAAIPWSRDTFVKDILAMSNVIDGGMIIVGVEDKTFVRQGLSPELITTYDIDVMRDGIAPFADPRAVFDLSIVSDGSGKQYAVISVYPFDDLPVICRRDGADVQAGTIYVRSRDKRPQSARVASSSEMREIVERASVLSARRLKKIGFIPDIAAEYDYDRELEGL